MDRLPAILATIEENLNEESILRQVCNSGLTGTNGTVIDIEARVLDEPDLQEVYSSLYNQLRAAEVSALIGLAERHGTTQNTDLFSLKDIKDGILALEGNELGNMFVSSNVWSNWLCDRRFISIFDYATRTEDVLKGNVAKALFMDVWTDEYNHPSSKLSEHLVMVFGKHFADYQILDQSITTDDTYIIIKYSIVVSLKPLSPAVLIREII